MGRQRMAKHKGTPKYLYPYKASNGKIYYKYHHPSMPKAEPFGSDRAKAIEAANILNTQLSSGADLVAKVLNPDTKTFSDYISEFKAHLNTRTVNTESLSEQTLAEYHRIIASFEKHLGSYPLNIITRKHCADMLGEYPLKSQNKYRSILVLMFDYAVSDGTIEENPAAKIMPTPKQKRTRQPLSLEGFKAIYPHATPEMKNAMDLALLTLQRREDIRNFTFADWDDIDKVRMRQSKTWKHGNFLEFEIAGTSLESLIKRIRAECALPTPYLVHRNPERRKKNKTRDHWTQLAPRQISDGFKEARDASGFYSHLEPEEQPTFHEIRALGADLYIDMGWSEAEVQALLGHTSLKQTMEYLDRSRDRYKQVKKPSLNI